MEMNDTSLCFFMYIQTSKCMKDKDEGIEGGSKGTKRQI